MIDNIKCVSVFQKESSILQIKKPFHCQKIKICRLRSTNCNIQILNDHFHLSWVEIMTHWLVICNICQKYKLLMLLQKKGVDQTRILHFSFQWLWTWPNNIVSKSKYMHTLQCFTWKWWHRLDKIAKTGEQAGGM